MIYNSEDVHWVLRGICNLNDILADALLKNEGRVHFSELIQLGHW
jgi:hypothetical protein